MSSDTPKGGPDRKKLLRLNDLLRELAAARHRQVKRQTARVSKISAELKARRERTATTVHDLKVPITISLLNLELGEMESDAGEKQNYLTGVRRELEFLLDTIGNLLDIEHAEQQAMELKIEKLDLKNLVDGVIARMTVLTNDKPDLTIRNDLPKRLPPLSGDRNKLVRLFNNLISNSVKYTERGTIRVGSQRNRDKGRLTVFVKDSGTGIEADRLPQLFEFFSGDALRQDSSGVGLAFVKQVVAAHCGRVWLESKKEVGTTVFVEFCVD